jgi:hypothetical protein
MNQDLILGEIPDRVNRDWAETGVGEVDLPVLELQ